MLGFVYTEYMRFLLLTPLLFACTTTAEPTHGELLLEMVWVDMSNSDRSDMCDSLGIAGIDEAWDIIASDLRAEGVTRAEFTTFFEEQC